MQTNLCFFRSLIPCTLLFAPPAVVLGESDTAGGWFIGAGLTDVDASRVISGFVLDGEESGWSLYAGYTFNKYLAIQGGYHNLGKNHFATDCPPPNVCVTQNLERVDIDGVSIAAVGTWPVSRTIDLYGKVGLMRWETDFERFALDESGEDLIYGIGLAVNVSPEWRLSLQYEELDFDVETMGLGLSYRF